MWQERKQYKEALEAVKGPLGDAFNLEGERELVEARLMVCYAASFTQACKQKLRLGVPNSSGSFVFRHL